MPLRLISTDFDGTLFAEFEKPPVPDRLVRLLAHFQGQGAKWIINTGRELASLLETLGRAQLPIQPDLLVLVEREIYVHDGVRYLPDHAWNSACDAAHNELFARVRPDLPDLTRWIAAREPSATVYEDPFSPLCVISKSNAGAEAITRHLEAYARQSADLSVVRNDVYIRFSHAAYDKGRCLAEIARQTGAEPHEIVAAGDHFNDLPKLRREIAHHLIAPANAIPEVKAQVTAHGGYISAQPCGHGVAAGLEFLLERV
ncbi:MAG: HAD family hydrolase [Limisphaerales bacterium]